MSTLAASRRVPSPLDVLRLQVVNPTRLVVVPIVVTVGVVVVMTAVVAVLLRFDPHAGNTEYNGTFLWSIVGYVSSIGVQAVTVAFPLALSLGTTRRTFVLGVFATLFAEAAMLTAVSLLLLGVETLTGGWFVGAKVFGDATLGDGNPLLLAVIVFLTMLTAMSVAGVYGAAFVRFGAVGPIALGLGVGVVLAVALLVFLPAVVAALAGFQLWWLAVAAGALIVVSLPAQALLLRGASVR